MTGSGTAFAVYRGCLIDRGKDFWSVHRPEICQLACCYPLVQPSLQLPPCATPLCNLACDASRSLRSQLTLRHQPILCAASLSSARHPTPQRETSVPHVSRSALHPPSHSVRLYRPRWTTP